MVRYFTWDGSTIGTTWANNMTLSNGNRTVARTSTGSAPRSGRSIETIAVGEDFETYVKLDVCSNVAAGNTGIGLCNGSMSMADNQTVGQNANGCAYFSDGTVFRGGANVSPISGAAVAAMAVNDIIGIRVTRSAGTNRVSFSHDNGATWSGDYAITVLGDSNIIYLAYTTYFLNDQWTAQAAAAATATGLGGPGMMGVG